MTLRRRARPRAQFEAGFIQAFENLLRTEHTDLRCRELDRERQPYDPLTDLLNDRTMRFGLLELGLDGHGASFKQLTRGALRPIRDYGHTGERRQPKQNLPRDFQRFLTRRQD